MSGHGRDQVSLCTWAGRRRCNGRIKSEKFVAVGVRTRLVAVARRRPTSRPGGRPPARGGAGDSSPPSPTPRPRRLPAHSRRRCPSRRGRPCLRFRLCPDGPPRSPPPESSCVHETRRDLEFAAPPMTYLATSQSFQFPMIDCSRNRRLGGEEAAGLLEA
ncbi:hypothetical protein DAI22_04g119400 [Oryza sativa Japonica Group]|nr:hypothetical protein DAI22_04g119400 [Oryza sativa Japonica Group]